MRPGAYPDAAAWLGGHAIFADLRSHLRVVRCVVDQLPHRIRLGLYAGIGYADAPHASSWLLLVKS